VIGNESANEYSKENYIVLVVRSPDNTISPSVDKTVDKSDSFPIPQPGKELKIEVPLSQSTIARLYRIKSLDYYLYMLPKRVRLSDVHTLGEMEEQGGSGFGLQRNRINSPDSAAHWRRPLSWEKTDARIGTSRARSLYRRRPLIQNRWSQTCTFLTRVFSSSRPRRFNNLRYPRSEPLRTTAIFVVRSVPSGPK
jgi:hypothetical protein